MLGPGAIERSKRGRNGRRDVVVRIWSGQAEVQQVGHFLCHDVGVVKKKFQPNQTRARPKNKYLTSSRWEMCNRLPIYTIFSLLQCEL